MGRRHLTTAITLLVLVGILVVGFLIGTKSLFAPLPGDANPKADPSPTCSPKSVKKGQAIRSAQVQVSVFNGGSRVRPRRLHDAQAGCPRFHRRRRRATRRRA